MTRPHFTLKPMAKTRDLTELSMRKSFSRILLEALLMLKNSLIGGGSAIITSGRPHEALGMDVPASRYQPSYNSYQEVIPDYDYSPEHIFKKVDPECHDRATRPAGGPSRGRSYYP